jgi:NADPH:quinone reductase-like Zn-dependent oxidoreductase
MEATMKAVQIQEYGDADVLRYVDVDAPTLKADDVLIRVVGSSVNPVDWKIRAGHMKEMVALPMPAILGWDVSGVVQAVGKSVTTFSVGDEVYSRPDIARPGTYAELVAVRASEVAHKPHTISHIEAGVLPLAGITAWEAMVTVGNVADGQRVLVHAASGGVGSLAVQIAKARGAYVMGTASSQNRALVESLGVDEFIDYHAQPFQDVAKDIDVVFDTIGGETQEASWTTMSPNGILVAITSPPEEETARQHGVRSAFVYIGPNVPALGGLTALIERGELRPIIGAEFALADIGEAHRLSESGRAKGKIALYVGQP